MRKVKTNDDGVPLNGGIAFNRGYAKHACPFRDDDAQRDEWLLSWGAARQRAEKTRDDELLNN